MDGNDCCENIASAQSIDDGKGVTIFIVHVILKILQYYRSLSEPKIVTMIKLLLYFNFLWALHS